MQLRTNFDYNAPDAQYAYASNYSPMGRPSYGGRGGDNVANMAYRDFQDEKAWYNSGRNPLALAAGGSDLVPPGSGSGTTPNYLGDIPYPTYNSILNSQSKINNKNITGENAWLNMGPAMSQFTAPNFNLQSALNGQPDYLQQLQQEQKGLANLTSPWVKLMRDQIGSDYQTQRQVAQANVSGQLQNAFETLASRGGARSGARERLASMGQGELFKAMQTLGKQRSDQLRNIDTKSYETSLGLLEKLPGLQLQKAQYETGINEQNITNLLTERARQHQFELDKYKAQMQAWAADKTGQAYANAADDTSFF